MDKCEQCEIYENMIRKFIERNDPDAYGDFQFALVRIGEKYNDRGERIKQLEESLEEILKITPCDILGPMSERMKMVAREALSQEEDEK